MAALFGEASEQGPPEGKDAPAASLADAIFTNRQVCADFWAEAELSHKLQSRTDESTPAPSAQRARLLKLWSRDVSQAAALGVLEEAAADASVPAAWLWAALSPAGAEGAWEDAIGRLCAEDGPQKGPDALHFAAAAALALGRADDAVRIYLRAELFADALLLARLRFPARHPLVLHVYQQWASDLRRRGRFDQAAACHLAVGKVAAALSDLEEHLSTPRSHPGPELSRLLLAVAAARLSIKVVAGAPSPALPEPDATLAFDHRRWWGRTELRTAVRCWTRALAEALRSDGVTSDGIPGIGALPLTGAKLALSLARVPSASSSSPADEAAALLLRSLLAGYASAAGWWLQLTSETAGSAAEGCNEGEEEASPLQRFLDQGQEALVPDGDWDLEWRLLTWLPAFDSRAAEPLLVAAVELGRACASLASGCSRGSSSSSSGDAPWEHVASALHALLGALDPSSPASVALPLAAVAAPMRQLSRLALRPDGSRADQAWGACVATMTDLTIGAGSLAQPWNCLNQALFGLPAEASSDSQEELVATSLRRGYRACVASPSASLLSEVCLAVAEEAASAGGSSAWRLELTGLCRKLAQAAVDAARECGLEASATEMQAEAAEAAGLIGFREDAADSEVAEGVAAWLRHLRASCAAPLLVSLAVARAAARALPAALAEGGRGKAAEEYGEYVLAEQGAAVDAVSVDAVGLLRGLGNFFAEAESDAEAPEAFDAGELEAFECISRLEVGNGRLAWSSRLALLYRRFGEDSSATAPRCVCALLAALPEAALALETLPEVSARAAALREEDAAGNSAAADAPRPSPAASASPAAKEEEEEQQQEQEKEEDDEPLAPVSQKRRKHA
eukprot:TRINITY_DN21968_c0_g1_i1.p1 TRINITY_DN21968_c0_g1~~TRINITY_DN21968_c0_g1_i1.p1  ORF type:complete len:958 (-),score=249.16 TRINITY_DN21968_c0_g1_i1:18-2582(-)